MDLKTKIDLAVGVTFNREQYLVSRSRLAAFFVADAVNRTSSLRFEDGRRVIDFLQVRYDPRGLLKLVVEVYDEGEKVPVSNPIFVSNPTFEVDGREDVLAGLAQDVAKALPIGGR